MTHLQDLQQLTSITRGDPRVVIAILDGPVDLSHPALVGADLRDLSGCTPNGRGEAAAFHGTHVCSIIFGQGAEGVMGIAPDCRGIVIPIFRDGPTPDTILPSSQIELAVAIDRAVTEGANIINVSGGQYSVSGTIHPILKRVIDSAAEAGVLIVSAAGNDACRCHHIPSADSTVLAVGAHDRNGQALEISNWGDLYRDNGVVALGEDVLGAVPGGTRLGTGTSFATPIVTGVAALLMSCQLKAGKPANGAQVQQAIIESAHRCFDLTESCQRMLAGKLNPLGALNNLLEESYPMSNHNQENHPMINPSSNQPNSDVVQAEFNPAAAPIASEGQIPQTMSSGPPAGPTAAPLNHVENPQRAGVMAAESVPAASTGIATSSAGVQPSSCGCGCSSSQGSLVYVIGEIGFDYGTEARRDSIISYIVASERGDVHPQEEERLAQYLDKKPYDAASVIWTISINNVPIYAVKPNGPYAPEAYKMLVEFLDDNHKKSKKRQCNHVAIPGRVVGKVALLRTGHVVPVIEPEIRGMANWDTAELVAAALKDEKAKKDKDKKDKDKDHEELEKSLTKILEKIYQEHQSLGIRPQDRAINYAASNTTEITKMIKDAKENKGGTMFFDKIECEPSPICRPGSECWIIKISFFVHDKTDRSRRMYRFTVDVSDVVPVSLADMQDWFVR